jgi:hypothetical protein
MNALNSTNSFRFSIKQPVFSKHEIFRDKQRRRERMQASIVAQARKGWR